MNAPGDQPWRPLPDGSGVIVRVRLTPRSSTDAIAGPEPTKEGPALAARVRAVPSDGAANGALERLLAHCLDLPKRSVAVTQGHKSRIKSVTLTGSPGLICRRLEQIATSHGSDGDNGGAAHA